MVPLPFIGGDSDKAGYAHYLKKIYTESRVNDFCSVRGDKMSKQLWILKMSGDWAGAECHKGLLS